MGSIGAALVALVGAHEVDNLVQAAQQLVKVQDRYLPNPEHRAVYDRQYEVFKGLYRANRKAFSLLNSNNQPK